MWIQLLFSIKQQLIFLVIKGKILLCTTLREIFVLIFLIRQLNNDRKYHKEKKLKDEQRNKEQIKFQVKI